MVGCVCVCVCVCVRARVYVCVCACFLINLLSFYSYRQPFGVISGTISAASQAVAMSRNGYQIGAFGTPTCDAGAPTGDAIAPDR